MAKKSAIEKNLRRQKLVKKYANKRAALKKIIKNRKLELSERFVADLTAYIENLRYRELHLEIWHLQVKFLV